MKLPRGATKAWTISLLLALIGLASCGGGQTSAKGNIQVLYAGSLVNVMEKSIGPGYTKATGYGYQGEGKGSTALANEITGKLRSPDIFISADPAVNTLLMGSAHGNYVSWYLDFATSPLVIAFNPNSRFAPDLQAVASGAKNWYDVLREPGLRLGRTDPELDPKGYRTIIALQLAERYYNVAGLRQQILGTDQNPAQIYPEEELVARLGAGQLDAGFFYLSEALDTRLPIINLPAQINLSSPALTTEYATASYTTKKGVVIPGAPIVYTITIPSTSKNLAGATAFVQYLLQGAGKSVLNAHGLTTLPYAVGGDKNAVPSALAPLVAGS